MIFRKIGSLSIAAMLVLTILGAPIGAVAAQEGGNAPTTDDDGEPVYVGQIDKNTRLLEAEYENGTVTIVLESDIPNLITYSDYSAVGKESEGVTTGKPGKLSVSSGRTEITIDVAPVDNRVVVTIGTSRGYAILRFGDNGEIFDEDPTWNDARIAGLSVLGGGGWLLVGAVLWRTGNYSPKVRRRL